MKKKLQPLKLVFFFLFFVFLTFILYHLEFKDKVYPGVRIAGLNVGNLTKEEAATKIDLSLRKVDTTKILLVETNRNWELDLETLNYNLDETSDTAFRIGRSGNLLIDLKEKKNAWLGQYDLRLDYELESLELQAQITTIAGQIFSPFIEPSIRIQKTPAGPIALVDPGEEGKELDQPTLINQVNKQLGKGDFSPISLPIKQSANITQEEKASMEKRANMILIKKLTLSFLDSSRELSGEELTSYLSFKGGFDQEKIENLLSTLAPSINLLPQNPLFQFNEGRVDQFRPAKEGARLDETKSQELILEALESLENGKNESQVSLAIKIIPPDVTTDQVNSLGIKELVGRGVSYFKGSIPSRIHNITLAASKLNGILIPPGEVFSFNQSLGDVSSLTGFQPAYIIQNGRTVLGDGGGVCQVSTTFFRAALNAGLPIIERRAHAYRVGYYEQQAEVGQDATVFSPTVDLKIKNDTSKYLLVQTTLDPVKAQLTVDFYGTSDNRVVTLSKSKIWNQTAPPPDLYQDDPTLPLGQVKQVDWKAWGAKVSFNWKVTRGSEVLQDKTFYSSYRPWQSVYLRGTKPL